MHFPERNCINTDYDYAEVYSQGSNEYYSRIGSDNGLVLVRRPAIIWTNDCYSIDTYMCHTAPMS